MPFLIQVKRFRASEFSLDKVAYTLYYLFIYSMAFRSPLNLALLYSLMGKDLGGFDDCAVSVKDVYGLYMVWLNRMSLWLLCSLDRFRVLSAEHGYNAWRGR